MLPLHAVFYLTFHFSYKGWDLTGFNAVHLTISMRNYLFKSEDRFLPSSDAAIRI